MVPQIALMKVDNVVVQQAIVGKCALSVCLVGIGHQLIACAQVKIMIHFLKDGKDVSQFKYSFLDCSCNTVGTTSSSSECADTSGDCTCATGYSGQMCSSCISGWYWTSTASTCTGKIDKYNCLNVKHV